MPDDDFPVRLPRQTRLRLWMYRRARTWLSALAVLLILGTAATMAVLLPRVEERNVAGTVRCMSGRPVVGVYVHDSGPGSGGWARRRPDGGDPSVARYQRDDVRGSSHSLSVGCGGVPRDWAAALQTPVVEGGYHDFRCFDTAVSSSGRCALP